MKRLFDIVLAGVGLTLFAPVLLAVAVWIKITSPGPVFYRGVRIGRNGVPFRIFKFRTMVVDAERLGGSATPSDDPRLTPIGRRLRGYKLDELPQLLNVLNGDMSFVGPRPEVAKYVHAYSVDQARVLALRPGITDWASIWNSDEGAVLAGSADPERDYERVILPTKLLLQREYAERNSLWIDVKIISHTLIKIFNSRWIPRELIPYGAAIDYVARPAHLQSRGLRKTNEVTE